MSVNSGCRLRLRLDRRLLATVHDVTMAGLSLLLSIRLRLGEQMWSYAGWDIVWWTLTFCGIAAVCFRIFGMNSGVWRYASLSDMAAIARAATLTILCFLLISFLWWRLEALPRSVPVINWFVLVVLLGGPRIVYRWLKDHRNTPAALLGPEQSTIPVLLIGAGNGAELFIRAMAASRHAKYRVVGVIDEKGGRVGRKIHNIDVKGTLDGIDDVVSALEARGERPQKLILTKPAAGPLVQRLVAIGERLDLAVARLPELTEFRRELDSGMPEPRPIAIEDLLGRPQISLNRHAISNMLAGKTIIVTGAGGSIGSELSRQIAGARPSRLVVVDSSEFNLYSIDLELTELHPGLVIRPVLCDVRDRAGIMRLFNEERPNLVFHAAALKHVPMVEYNPCEGILTNAMGTRNVADAASEAGVTAMVLISTDKAVNPTNVMGASKRIAECYCQSLDLQQADRANGTRFMTVRFGNVLGSSGSVVPLFQRQLRAGGPLTVTHPDIRRYFMTIREAVELVLQASAYGVSTGNERGKIFVLDMGEPVRIYDLARQMIHLSGLRPDIDIKITCTGLRPGEKLFEELFDVAEPPERTGAEGVLVAAPRAVDFGILCRSLDELAAAAAAGHRERLITQVKHVVPEFQHASSAPGASAPSAAPVPLETKTPKT